MKTNNINTFAKAFTASFITSFCQAYVLGTCYIAIAKKVKEKRLLKERVAIGSK